MSERRSEELARATLAAREAGGLLRTRRSVDALDATHVRIDGRTYVNFSGNDYLGMTHDPRVLAAIRSAASAGSGSAALVSGRTQAHASCERAIAQWKGVDDAVLLPSGYQANFAAIQTMATLAGYGGRKPRFLIDKLVHASLIDAVRSTGVDMRVYPHNHVAKLERLLREGADETSDVVVTESIFSMDGDAAALAAVVALRGVADFALVVDEAHATGLYGPAGAGLVSAMGLTADVDLGIATFSKAVGVVGGSAYGSHAMIEAVVNFGRAYVYTTSPPAHVARAIEASIEVIAGDASRLHRLRANVTRLRAGVAAAGLKTIDGDSPIVPVIVGDEAEATRVANRLREGGFLVVAIRPPTVPCGTSRLRLTVSSEHSADEVSGLLRSLRQWA